MNNVACGLRRFFGLRTSAVSALVDNAIGRFIEDLILEGGVYVSLIQWEEFDDIDRILSNGLNFNERGYGVLGAIGVSDRGHTAVS